MPMLVEAGGLTVRHHRERPIRLPRHVPAGLQRPLAALQVSRLSPPRRISPRDRTVEVVGRAPYIAENCRHPLVSLGVLSSSPMRDSDLLENQMVYALARAAGNRGTPPGYGRARSPGIGGTTTTSTASTSEPASNTDTYKYYIDFASKCGIEYIILGRGLVRALGPAQKSIPRSTCPGLLAYAESKKRRHHPLGRLEDARGPDGDARYLRAVGA